MLKLTRLNNHIVAINPDHISWAEATPDTTLFLLGGEKLIVRESLDELIDLVVRFRRLIRGTDTGGVETLGAVEGDPPRVSRFPPRVSASATRPSILPPSRYGRDR